MNRAPHGYVCCVSVSSRVMHLSSAAYKTYFSYSSKSSYSVISGEIFSQNQNCTVEIMIETNAPCFGQPDIIVLIPTNTRLSN